MPNINTTLLPMSGMKMFNNLTRPQSLAAWAAAGAAFGVLYWFENRDNGKVLSAEELRQQNRDRVAKLHGAPQQLKRPTSNIGGDQVGGGGSSARQ